METDEIMDKVYTKAFEEGRESPVNFAGDLVEAIKITREDTATQIFAELDKLDIGIGTITGEDGETAEDIRAVYIKDYLTLKSKYDIK